MALPVVEQMLDAAVHAPGTARGVYTGPGIAIGWAGETDTCEPATATNEYGTLHASADAHIVNAALLRAELADLGHRFHGETPHELILRVYEQWGVRGFTRLRGPFACAVWDGLHRRLVVARDHVGLRPLYFAVLPDHGFVFASELRALLRDPGVGREWCPAAIDAYLAVGYIPAPLSAYRRVSKLEAGHVLIVEGRRFHLEPYWDLPWPQRDRYGDERALLDGLSAGLRRAVGEHTADGQVDGLLYSGGTASTTLLSAASPASITPVTVAFDTDPSQLARSGRAAAMLGRAREIESVTLDVAMLARELAASCDEPLADPSAIAQAAMCLGAHQHTECALAAHGTAALWGGYARHRIERLEATVRAWLVRPLSTVSAEVGRSLQDAVRGARALSHLRLPPADAYAVKHAYGFWDDEYRHALYTRDFAWQVRDSNPFTRHLELYASRETPDPLDRALYVDAHTSLPDGVLPAADCAARVAGLRLRMPMLDPDLVDRAASLPGAWKQRGPAGMYALRSLLARELGPSLLPPPYRVPARHAWLPAALGALVPNVLFGPRFDARGIVSRPALHRLWREHRTGHRNHAHRLWSLLMLELWLRDAIDGNAADVPLEYAVLKAA